MNIVFSIIVIISAISIMFVAPENVLPTLISGGSNGLNFALKLFSIYAVWLSILQIWTKLRFDLWLGDKLKPLLHKIFPKENDTCYGYLSINLSANMLGMGSAGTPAGISSIENMQSKKNRIMLLVINSSSVQIIPTTIIAMRSSLGSATDIILPSILATFISTFLGFILVKIFVK